MVTETAGFSEIIIVWRLARCGIPEDSHLGYQAGLELMDCGRAKSQGQTEVERR